MTETTIVLMGLPLKISYQWHSPDKIEWHLTATLNKEPTQEEALLEALLREYKNFEINLILWDEFQAHRYEEDERAIARAEAFMPF